MSRLVQKRAVRVDFEHMKYVVSKIKWNSIDTIILSIKICH